MLGQGITPRAASSGRRPDGRRGAVAVPRRHQALGRADRCRSCRRTRPTSSSIAKRRTSRGSASELANIYEVAELAGVSLATVSRVINPGAKVSEKTRQKVLAAMQQLGYQPNSIAQSLATRSSNAVGVLVSELHGPFFGAMLSAIEQTLQGRRQVRAGGGRSQQRGAGARSHPLPREPQLRRAHRSRRAPVRQIPRRSRPQHHADRGHEPQGARHSPIIASASTTSSAVTSPTQSLLKHKHKRIAYISGPLDWVDAKQRFAATSARLPRRA